MIDKEPVEETMETADDLMNLFESFSAGIRLGYQRGWVRNGTLKEILNSCDALIDDLIREIYHDLD